MPLLQTFGNDTARGWERFGPVGSAAAYELISTTVVGAGGVTSVTFTNAGSWNVYKHLQIRSVERGNQSGTGLDSLLLQFNGDTGSNYSQHYLEGIGSGTPGSGANTTQTRILIGGGNTASSLTDANAFSTHITDILDWSSTTKNKTVRTLGGLSQSSNPRITLVSGAWYNSSTAVSSITMALASASSFVQYSRFSLYGLRG